MADNEDAKFGSSPMRDAAIGMHEMYETLKSAGFSRRDSLELIAKLITTSFSDAISSAQEENEEE